MPLKNEKIMSKMFTKHVTFHMSTIITCVHVYNKNVAWEMTKMIHENSQIYTSYIVLTDRYQV